MPVSLSLSSARRKHSFQFSQAAKQFPPLHWHDIAMGLVCVCKVGMISLRIFIFNEQWDVICMHLNMHISVFFRESFVFIFVVFDDSVMFIFFISPLSL